jgi:hypothetical protein
MNWPFLTREDVIRIAIAVMAVGLAVLVALIIVSRKLANGGFGPEWQCTAMPLFEAIAERMPEVGRRYYQQVIAKTISELAAYLAARVKAGDLVIDDLGHAASQFMLSCQASLFLPFILQASPPPSRAQIETSVRSATRMFLAAYRKG